MSLSSNFDGYSYYINDDSDEDDIKQDSSEDENLDEINVFLHGTPDQKRKALKSLTGDEASSSDDDFEKLMQGELEAKVKALEESWKKSDGAGTAKETESPGTSTSKPDRMYGDVYFDSDDEEKADSSKRKIPTDEELLYDPHADEEDQKWVDMQRRRQPRLENTDKSKKAKQRAKSDAGTILTCPACMSTLCMDCQRHSLYENQFRAMFVVNCTVKKDERLHYKPKKKKEFRRHQKRQIEGSQTASSSNTTKESETGTNEADSYHPVVCSTCNTEVAVYDVEEIYHFFNVLSS